MDMDKSKLIVRLEDAREIFKLYNSPKQPLFMENLKSIAEKVQQRSNEIKHKCLRSFGRNENGEFKVWRAKRGCKAENCKECKAARL